MMREPGVPAAVGSRTPSPDLIEVSVRRTTPDAPSVFKVQRDGAVVVLDLLVRIQQEHDPTLAFRYSCRVAACGTCTVQVDGRPALACQSVVPPTAEQVSLKPLGGFPPVRDLVVDDTGFRERWNAADPWLILDAAPLSTPPGFATGPVEDEVGRALDCISCGACFSACPIADVADPFLGPASLTRLLALVADPRDGGAMSRLEIAGASGGIDHCHQVGACTEVCPKAIDPARAIRRLRRRRLLAQ